MTNTANDKNGVALALGDEVVFRGPVVEMREGSVLTRIHTANMGIREQWFHGSWVERSAQGAASLEAGKVAAPAAPANSAIDAAALAAGGVTVEKADPNSPKEQAIAFVMENAPYTREEAEKIVEEHGTLMILADRNEAEELKKKAAAGSVGSNPPAAASPATSPSVASKPIDAAAQNEAAAPGASSAGTEGTSAA